MLFLFSFFIKPEELQMGEDQFKKNIIDKLRKLEIKDIQVDLNKK